MFKRTKKTQFVGWEEINDISQQFLDLPKCSCFNREFCKEKLEKIIVKLQKYGLLRQGCIPLIHAFHIYQQICFRKTFSHVPDKCGMAFIYTICTAILVAEKFNTDIPYNNKCWSRLLGVKLHYLNQFEILIMTSEVKLHIKVEELLENVPKLVKKSIQ